MQIMGKYVICLVLLAVLSCKSNSSNNTSVTNKSYITEEIHFFNDSANIRIAGTLTYPKGKGPFPAVILVPGSGNTNRDGSDNELHKPFFEIADYLARKGMVVLRCDKRGVGESGGVLDFNTTIEDLASDIKASVYFLLNNPVSDIDNIGLIGHSKGGIVAAKVAADLPSIVSFVVLLASPGISHGKIVSQQLADIPKAFGISNKTIEKFKYIIDSTMIILNYPTSAENQSAMLEDMYIRRIGQVTDDEIEAMSKTGYVFQRNAQLYAQMVMLPFWNEFYSLDPGSIYMLVKCPILSIIGQRDLQVRPGPNQEAIRRALDAGNNENHTLITQEKMNHLFQRTATGSPEEYYKMKETMSAPVLKTVNSWIQEQVDNRK